jgi:hypothetical protein
MWGAPSSASWRNSATTREACHLEWPRALRTTRHLCVASLTGQVHDLELEVADLKMLSKMIASAESRRSWCAWPSARD